MWRGEEIREEKMRGKKRRIDRRSGEERRGESGWERRGAPRLQQYIEFIY